MKSQTLSVYIEAPSERVYAYAANPENLPVWAPLFFKSITRVNGDWVADTPLGQAVFAFVDANPFGVLDHRISVTPGLIFNNPMRVIANGSGSELMFTLFQHGGMSDQAFAQDAALVRGDLDALRRLIESGTV